MSARTPTPAQRSDIGWLIGCVGTLAVAIFVFVGIWIGMPHP